MLQIAPEGAGKTETEETTDDVINCAMCGHLVTRGRWRLDIDGHEHVFFNPAGRVFRVLCFREAPGAADQGDPTGEFTWFKGYKWNFAHCRGCNAHLGWRFTGTVAPPVFFGLIKGKLAGPRTGGDASKS
jgi:hypothetical protein